MTVRGKVFKAYAEAIVARHGVGSNKMVAKHSPQYIEWEIIKGQRLISRYDHLLDAIEITLEELEEAEQGAEEGRRIWAEIDEAEKWLKVNGYIREYEWYHDRPGTTKSRGGTSVGLTGKGWRLADRYLNAGQAEVCK